MVNMEKEFEAVKGLIVKENLRSISIAKSDLVENVAWTDIISKLRKALEEVQVKIIICLGIVQFVPPERREEILEDLHASGEGCHRGANKTYRKVRQRYYWESLKEDVQNFIRTCVKCQTKKLVRVKNKLPMQITTTSYSSLSYISLDIVGPFPASKKGNTNILTIQCNLSKYSLAIPLKNATAESVAEALITRYICIFGCPLAILTDQGTNFTSKLFKAIAKKFRVKKITTSAYTPQANGSIERYHASLTQMIKTLIDKETEWDDCLELATFCFNTTVHCGHGFEPYHLIFGKSARLPASEPVDPSERIPTFNEYLENLSTRLYNVQKIAREKLINLKLKWKYYYDRKINPTQLKVGDHVWLLKGGRKYKLGEQYLGPYLVEELFNNNTNVKIKISEKQSMVVHANRLRVSYIEYMDKTD